MNNITTTRDVICNNIHGSFFVVMWREGIEGKIDFIDNLRLSVYHHIIIKEGDHYTLPDIMEPFLSANTESFSFNNINEQNKESNYWVTKSDIKENNTTAEEVYNTFVEILENKSTAILTSRISMYQKLCNYKVSVMKGQDLPTYGVKIIGNDVKSFDLFSGDDIIGGMDLKQTYINSLKRIL